MDSAYFIRQTFPSDIAELTENMRDCDVRELKAAHGEDVDIEAVLRESVKMSTICRTWADAQGKVVMMFGLVVHQDNKEIGIPWVLATHHLTHFSKTFIRESHAYLQAMHATTPYLINFVDVRNVSSIRYLRSLGFEIHEAQPFGKQGLPFHAFDKMQKGMRTNKLLSYLLM